MGIITSKITTWVIIFPLLVVNLILSSALFYLLVPLISPTYNVEQAQRSVQKIAPMVGADAIVFWAVNLETNSRKAISYMVANKDDHADFTRYIEMAQVMKFTAAVNPTVTQALLSGQGLCYRITDTGIISTAVVGHFLQNSPNAMACVVPILNSAGILNSYVLMIWKQPIDLQSQHQIIYQVKASLGLR